MRFTKPCAEPAPVAAPLALMLALTMALSLTACSHWWGGRSSKAPARSTPGAAPVPQAAAPKSAPDAAGSPSARSTVPMQPKRSAQPVPLGPPQRSRNWAEVREQAAQRLVAANPGLTYDSPTPNVLLAIPVLSVQLNADGTIKYIDVMRRPGQALDTLELAKAAMRRAEPFGDVSHLPKPWRFNETFLFNHERKFKPLTLDR